MMITRLQTSQTSSWGFSPRRVCPFPPPLVVIKLAKPNDFNLPADKILISHTFVEQSLQAKRFVLAPVKGLDTVNLERVTSAYMPLDRYLELWKPLIEIGG